MKTLYLSDLDGTLIRSNEKISRYTADVINRFVSEGSLFSYATARSIVSASKVTEGMRANFPVICYNGAFILKNGTGEILSSHFFERETVEAIRQTLRGRKPFPITYAYIEGKHHFSYREAGLTYGMAHFLKDRMDDPRRRVAEDEAALYEGDIFYFSLIGEAEDLAPVYEIFRDDPAIQCIYHKDIYSGAQWLELAPAKATKAHAALWLKEALGCDRLVAFGDGMNDLSLFSVADECYAMENAVPELKEIATGVIGSNDEDGVGKWVEALRASNGYGKMISTKYHER